jgi:hypothetical protein
MTALLQGFALVYLSWPMAPARLTACAMLATLAVFLVSGHAGCSCAHMVL